MWRTLVCLSLATICAWAAAAERPNIVFVLADDMEQVRRYASLADVS